MALDFKTATEKRHTSALSTVPNLHALVAQINAVVIFCLRGSGFIVYFAILRSYFLVPPDGPKNGTENGTVKVLFFCSFTELCMGSENATAGFNEAL